MSHDFLGKVQEIQGPMSVELESWVKLLIRIRERIEIVYIFVSVLIGFIIAMLSWLTLPGCLPKSGRIPFEQPK